MRRIIVSLVGAAGLALPLACGSHPVGNGTCSDVSGSNHAWLVVVHGSHQTVDRCVGFDSAAINGIDLMKASQVQYATQKFGSLGDAFCSIDNEPAHYASCLPTNSPYWSDWVYQGGHWKSVTTTFNKVKVSPGGGLGWVYTPPSGNPPAPPNPPSS
ncbi:MAG TPA: hypothetical protein VF137_04130 [Candidatus Dormibacteraeota bacterium]